MKYENKRRLIIGISLGLLLVFYLFKNLSESIRVFGFIFGLMIFYVVDHMFEIEFKLKHYIYMIIILVFGILLSPFYFLSENYDKVLHLIMPIFGCLLIFHIINRKNLEMQWKLFITFMFLLSFLAMHEIGEYLLDFIWDLKLQGVYLRDIGGTEKLNLIMSQIDDTMVDLIIGTIGALLFVGGKTISYYYKRKFCKKK